VPVFVKVTAAPGTAAPAAFVTFPVKAPVVADWPQREALNSQDTAKTAMNTTWHACRRMVVLVDFLYRLIFARNHTPTAPLLSISVRTCALALNWPTSFHLQ